MSFDFAGYVTKHDVPCSDGRIIRHGAFQDCDGKRVPLVWQHMHDDINNVLGHVDLEVRNDGVYGYCSLNGTPSAQNAGEMIKHGDISSMSIYANGLKQRGGDVLHGIIREVSLVLSGANPEATIDNLNFAHSDGTIDTVEDEAIISFGQAIAHADSKKPVKKDDDSDDADDASDDTSSEEDEEDSQDDNQKKTSEEDSQDDNQKKNSEKDENPEDDDNDERKRALQHADGGPTVADIFNAMSEEKRNAVYTVIAEALTAAGVDLDPGQEASQSAISHADAEAGSDVESIFDSMTDEERQVSYYVIGAALEEAGISQSDLEKLGGSQNQNETSNEEVEHSDVATGQGSEKMANNIFENSQDEAKALSHDAMEEIFTDARRMGSLRDSFLSHGITSIDVLFPEAQLVDGQPGLISRRMEWVAGVLAATHKSPFSRVKSNAFNITAEEARARGYIKGNKKEEEQIEALKRVTTPQTIYKLQKLDRDDIIDITDIDVVAWLKQEMRTMLDEEIARAILVGDGRSKGSNDKIKEENIRPVWRDDPVYTHHEHIDTDTVTDPKEQAKAFIEACIRSRKYYKGSGTPTLYVGVDLLTEMRLLRDELGYRLYKTDQELADELRVSNIVEVEQFSEVKVDADEKIDGEGTTGKEIRFGGVIVNLGDYNVGTNRGGEVNFFDDFDLNYNKEEYLIETRMSGALVQPAAALAIDFLAQKGD